MSIAAVVVLILMHVEIATNHRCAAAFLYFGNVSIIGTQGTLSECRINGSVGILVVLDAELSFAMTNVFAGFHKVSRLPTVIHFHGHDRMMHSTMSVMATKAYFGESLIIEKRIVIKHRCVDQVTSELFDICRVKCLWALQCKIQPNIVSYSYFHIIIC